VRLADMLVVASAVLLTGCDEESGSTEPPFVEPPPTCSDGSHNGAETGIDCGGAESGCPTCAAGQACGAPDDCQSRVCSQAECQAPSCGDGVIQGDELCDDGNSLAGDGCAGCTIEDRWSCQGEPSACQRLGDWYVASDGDDEASGDLEHPFATLNRAWLEVQPGQLIYVRGGSYEFAEQQMLTGRSGTAEARILVWAYPAEQPVLSRAEGYAANVGVYFSGDYVHFKGFALTGYAQKPVAEGGGNVSSGMVVEDASHNVFERLDSHHNGHGMRIEGNSDDNLVLNCDFHHNQDPYTTPDTYGNADGLEVAYIPAGLSNTVRGCRFWWNTDDGLDLWENDGQLVVDDCWSWNNGFIPDTLDEGGDGNGFKLGLTTVDLGSAVLRTVTRSLAFDNRANGFDQNAGLCAMELYNDTAFANGGAGFAFGYSETAMTAKNDVSYQNASEDGFSAASVLEHDSWDGSVTVSDDDFASITPTGMDGPRGPDGSLPELPFMRLAPGSDLIDSGVDVGLPYQGSAPDLGAFETGGQ
jgi:cysteine-rich repeat protein